jgi:hypothetical protein
MIDIRDTQECCEGEDDTNGMEQIKWSYAKKKSYENLKFQKSRKKGKQTIRFFYLAILFTNL